MQIHEHANKIIQHALTSCLPDVAVQKALAGKDFSSGHLYMIAIGKAAWQMANCCSSLLKDRIRHGIVVTKYGHSPGPIGAFDIYEAGHPVPDGNSVRATQAAMDLVQDLHPEDTVIFLISGGGSALFECPLVPMDELQDITNQLLACGASIVEINTIRKRLSAVKGGRFAQLCSPAQVFSIVLSDIVGDPLDMIASGPTYPDASTCAQAIEIAEKYQLRLSPKARRLLLCETPKALHNIETVITGSVRELCRAAADACASLGYETAVLTTAYEGEAKEAGWQLAKLAQENQHTGKSLAFVMGGESVVHLTGHGKGGRNQELALAAAEGLDGLEQTLVFSVGSDGTDGPTDAAGAIVDGTTSKTIYANGQRISDILYANDAYPALKAANALIFTGPTGTNVNDVAVLLILRP